MVLSPPTWRELAQTNPTMWGNPNIGPLTAAAIEGIQTTVGSFLPCLCPQSSCRSVATSTSMLVNHQAVGVLTCCKKKALTKIQICIRCMVLPLGYSQGIFPDLMGVRRWGLNLKWVGLRTLGQLSTSVSYSLSVFKEPEAVAMLPPSRRFQDVIRPAVFLLDFLPFSGSTTSTISAIL